MGSHWKTGLPSKSLNQRHRVPYTATRLLTTGLLALGH
jgi:hypothetical protein